MKTDPIAALERLEELRQAVLQHVPSMDDGELMLYGCKIHKFKEAAKATDFAVILARLRDLEMDIVICNNLKEDALRVLAEFQKYDTYDLWAQLVRERDKLKEIIAKHDMCHDLHGKVGRDEFEEGCRRETVKEFGSCGWADRIAELEAENGVLHQYASYLTCCAQSGQHKPVPLDVFKSMKEELDRQQM